jgi:hypothetical protein
MCSLRFWRDKSLSDCLAPRHHFQGLPDPVHSTTQTADIVISQLINPPFHRIAPVSGWWKARGKPAEV